MTIATFLTAHHPEFHLWSPAFSTYPNPSPVPISQKHSISLSLKFSLSLTIIVVDFSTSISDLAPTTLSAPTIQRGYG